jgi:predicted amino acid racemase
MGKGTCLEIKLGKLTDNSRRVAEVCGRHGIEVLGVTKGFSAIPEIVSAMVNGGVTKLADSRLENITALRRCGFEENMTLLRIPMLSRAASVVQYADCSLNSELSVLQALSDAALTAGKIHSVILMIDVGDLREGIMPDDAADFMRKAMLLKGVRVSGVGTNMGCYGGVLPTETNLSFLLEIAHSLEEVAGYRFDEVSGGGTSSLELVQLGEMPSGINQLRIGEGILLGTDTTHNRAIPWLAQDAFLLKSEIVEIKSKPSLPSGEIGRDAFGGIPHFDDRGIRRRAIVALGRQDVTVEGITPVDARISLLGASSDHMILDIEDAAEPLRVGDQVAFRLNYSGLLDLCTSKYVRKVYLP